MGVAGQPTHRVLLAQEAVEIFRVKVGGQHLDRDRPIQQRLRASIHHAKAAVSDFGDIFESRVAQLRGNVRDQIPRRRMLIDVGHQRSLSSAGRPLTSVTNEEISPISRPKTQSTLGSAARVRDGLRGLKRPSHR